MTCRWGETLSWTQVASGCGVMNKEDPPGPPVIRLDQTGQRAVTRLDRAEGRPVPTALTAATENRYLARVSRIDRLRAEAPTRTVVRASTVPVALIRFAVTR